MLDQLPPVLHQQIELLVPQIVAGGVNLVTAIIILIGGIWLASRSCVWTIRALGRVPTLDDMLKGFFGSIVRYLVLTFTLLAVLAKFGVQTASLIAVLGAAGLAVGLALQGTLSNVAAGVMLLIFRPFRSGHYIQAGNVAGTVKSLTLFTTELASSDNVQIIVPNSQIWGQAISNFTFHPTRRLDMKFGISYADDIAQAIAIIQRELAADERCLAEPEPFVGVLALGERSVELTVRVWVMNASYWSVHFDMTRRIKERFDQAGITMPFLAGTIYTPVAQ